MSVRITTTSIGLLLLLLLGIYLSSLRAPAEPAETMVCTSEAKGCPDGSVVGRTGPNCSFAPCGSVTK